MPDELLKTVKVRLKILGWYQLIGGIIGIPLTVYLIARTGTINGLVLLLFALALVLYCFSTYSGWLLIKLKHKRGLVFSIINQVLQLFTVFIAGYGYLYIAGANLMAGMSYSGGPSGNGFKIGLNFGLASTWRFDFKSDDHSFSLGINLIAIFVIYFCYRLQQRINSKQEFGAADYIIENA